MPVGNIEEINLKTGESTVVQLKGLATAGYQWSYTTDDNKQPGKYFKRLSVRPKHNRCKRR